MAHVQSKQNKKDLNVELNLLPVFDVLSVCICFLLMTVVWVEVRSVQTTQAIGSESIATQKSNLTAELEIDSTNNLIISLKQKSKLQRQVKISNRNGTVNFEDSLKEFQKISSLKMTQLQIMPAKNTDYQSIIKLIDQAKSLGLKDVGLSPI